MLNLCIQLCDYMVRLLQTRKELKKDLLVNHVDYINDLFNNLHNNYMETFSKYRDMIYSSDECGTAHPVFNEIVKDYRFSRDICNQLEVVYDNYCAGRDYKRNDRLLEYLVSVIEYFQGSATGGSAGYLYSNVARSRLLESLKYIFNLNNKGLQSVLNDIKDRKAVMNDIYVIEYSDTTFIANDLINDTTKITGDNRDVIKKLIAISVIDRIVEANQNYYKDIFKQYNEMRLELLSAQ